LIVNAPASLAGLGAASGLEPSLTLGCGSPGHNSSSDNIGPMHLINIRRVARGIREIEDVRSMLLQGTAGSGTYGVASSAPAGNAGGAYIGQAGASSPAGGAQNVDLAAMVRQIINQLH
jgi:hypothetical protein